MQANEDETLAVHEAAVLAAFIRRDGARRLGQFRGNVLHADRAEDRVIDADHGLAGDELRVLQHVRGAVDAAAGHTVLFEEGQERLEG